MALESGETWQHTFRAEGSGGSDYPEHHLPAPATIAYNSAGFWFKVIL